MILQISAHSTIQITMKLKLLVLEHQQWNDSKYLPPIGEHYAFRSDS